MRVTLVCQPWARSMARPTMLAVRVGVSPSPENVFTSMVPKELKVIHAEGLFLWMKPFNSDIFLSVYVQAFRGHP